MSTLTADPGFPRGSVLGILWKAYDAENGDGSHVLGIRKEFLDTNPQTGVVNSNRPVECICVKNVSSAALLPGQVAKFKLAPTANVGHSGIIGEVDGLAAASDRLIGVVDEYLPTAGVPIGEVFWLVVRGPSTARKTTGTAVSAGDVLSTTATAGSIATGTTNQQLGFALADAASASTTGRILVRTQAGF
jgi:hypothetical protein